MKVTVISVFFVCACWPVFHLAVDETLYPCRGRINKYRLLYGSLCDSTVPYRYYTLVYAGKPDDLRENPLKKFYLSGTDEYTKYLMEGFNMSIQDILIFCMENKLLVAISRIFTLGMLISVMLIKISVQAFGT